MHALKTSQLGQIMVFITLKLAAPKVNTMKTILPLFVACLGFLSTSAQTKFFEGTWKEAAAEAKLQNKYLFVDCFTDWCYWCKVADKETFPDKLVGDFLNENFVAVQVDMEREGVYLSMKYRVTGFPSFLVFSPDGSFISKFTGYTKENSEFVEKLKTAIETDVRPNYPSKITDSVEFPSFYKSSFISKNGDQKKRVNPEINEINKWFSKNQDYTSEQAWSLIYKFNVGDKANNYFLDNLEIYETKYGKSEVEDKLYALAYSKLDTALNTLKMEDLDVAIDFAGKYLGDGSEDLKSVFLIQFYEATENWVGYIERAEILIDKHGFENHLAEINSYCWTIYLKTDLKDAMYLAREWMKRAVETELNYFYLDTYAAVLYKSGEYNEALSVIDKAILVGKDNEQNVDESLALRDKIVSAIDGK